MFKLTARLLQAAPTKRKREGVLRLPIRNCLKLSGISKKEQEDLITMWKSGLVEGKLNFDTRTMTEEEAKTVRNLRLALGQMHKDLLKERSKLCNRVEETG